jgi:hypothetical protein
MVLFNEGAIVMTRPYRSPTHGESTREAPARADRELRLVIGIFWVISVVQVAGALLRHEVFGAETTLALMAVLGLPCLIFAR